VPARCEHYGRRDGPDASMPTSYLADVTGGLRARSTAAGLADVLAAEHPGYGNLALDVDGRPMKNWPYLSTDHDRVRQRTKRWTMLCISTVFCRIRGRSNDEWWKKYKPVRGRKSYLIEELDVERSSADGRASLLVLLRRGQRISI
jgi:hypothetical protein